MMDKVNSRVIVYALLIWIILTGVSYLYDAQSMPFAIDTSNFVIISVKLVSHFLLAMIAGTMIFLSINKYFSKKFIVYSVGLVGCAICFYNVVMPLVNLKFVADMELQSIKLSQDKSVSQLKEIMNNKKIDLKIKSMLSSRLAENDYINTGRILEFVNEKGMVLSYVPGKNEIEQREQRIKSEIVAYYNLYIAKMVIYYQIIFWFSVFLFSVGFSVINQRNR